MNIGVSGTRKGITDAQRGRLYDLFSAPALKDGKLTHGGAKGVDEDAAWMWDRIHGPLSADVCPSDLRPDGNYPEPLYKADPKPPLSRNKDIVDNVDIMVILPQQDHEVLRSGTWMTYRWAIRQHVFTIVILPDGKIKFGPMEASS